VFVGGLGAIVGGEFNRLSLPRVDSALVVVIDGLGFENLSLHLGHARNLAGLLRGPRAKAIRSGFPSSTAVSLTSFGTGLRAGLHGILGYQTKTQDNRVRNMLSGWSPADNPRLWQTNPTVAEQAADLGVAVSMVAHSEYDGSGFTEVMMAGARFVGEKDPVSRARAANRVAGVKKTLTYLYFAELDQAAHRFGVNSPEWLIALETIDAAIGELTGRFGLIVTADHGVIDVAQTSHTYLDEVPGFCESVQLAVGDPRALYCYGNAPEARGALEAAGVEGYLATFDELIDLGWVQGKHSVDQVPDFVLIAKGDTAFYDRRTAKAQSLKMIGQHGGIDDRETRIPLLFGGLFS
jgi:hypothetical protein